MGSHDLLWLQCCIRLGEPDSVGLESVYSSVGLESVYSLDFVSSERLDLSDSVKLLVLQIAQFDCNLITGSNRESPNFKPRHCESFVASCTLKSDSNHISAKSSSVS